MEGDERAGRGSVNCRAFRERIFSLQAGELSESEGLDCRSHVEACPPCAQRLRFEDGALRALKGKLPRESAPPGLETRIRAALRAGRGEVQAEGAWRLRPRWLFASAAAVALALAALAVPALWPGRLSRGASADRPASGTVTVVDLACDRAGRSVEEQRRCTDRSHVNALRLADGSYWTIAAEPAEFRHLRFDARQRGQKLRVAGRLLGGTNEMRIESAEPLEARRGRPGRWPSAVPAAASSVP